MMYNCYIMQVTQRYGNPWTVPETLRLVREYDLLQLSVEEIAKLHLRTIRAIKFKLYAEGFADELIPVKNVRRTGRKNTHIHFY